MAPRYCPPLQQPVARLRRQRLPLLSSRTHLLPPGPRLASPHSPASHPARPPQHYDNRSNAPLTRAATIIVYLTGTQSGGGTYFPRAMLSRAYRRQAGAGFSGGGGGGAAAGAGGVQGRLALPEGVEVARGGAEPGLRVLPRTGRAILFWCASGGG
jgi:hypothetical protein